MPRFGSVVTHCADAVGAPSLFTQTFKAPFDGAIQASFVPSGETCGSMRSGLPKSTWRGTRGGRSEAKLAEMMRSREKATRRRIIGAKTLTLRMSSWEVVSRLRAGEHGFWLADEDCAPVQSSTCDR